MSQPELAIMYAQKQRKPRMGGGFVRRHWALLIIQDGTISIRCDVRNKRGLVGQMTYERTDNFDSTTSSDYSPDRFEILATLTGDIDDILEAIQGVATPVQALVNREPLPDCQTWCRDVVTALQEQQMVPDDTLGKLAKIPSTE